MELVLHIAFLHAMKVGPYAMVNVNALTANLISWLNNTCSKSFLVSSEVCAGIEEADADPQALICALQALIAEQRAGLQTQSAALLLRTGIFRADATQGGVGSFLDPGEYVVMSITISASCCTREAVGREMLPRPEQLDASPALRNCVDLLRGDGGELAMKSEVSFGVTFRLYLRALDQGGESVQDDMPEGWETILLVEDEEFVRNVTREVLEIAGYHVLEAQDAQTGMRLFQEHEGAVHLVLTDVVMPGINGHDLAHRLTELSPAIKIIYMSGYTDSELHRKAFKNPRTAFLQKPFTVASLTKKVREVLDFDDGAGVASPVNLRQASSCASD
ncbi:MAG TPA: response regulator [Clostridia bacterium]|nr:response regulator [Clostridia bacterium]